MPSATGGVTLDGIENATFGSIIDVDPLLTADLPDHSTELPRLKTSAVRVASTTQEQVQETEQWRKSM
jgi:hypothetical protein